MRFISDTTFSELFAEYPLYKKAELFDTLEKNQMVNVYETLVARAYKHYCPNQNDFQTFRFDKKFGEQLVFHETEIPAGLLDKRGLISYSFSMRSKCQFCSFPMAFFLNVFSQTPRSNGAGFPTIFIRKIGQWPAIERKPTAEVHNYLTREDRELYGKALDNLAFGYGIGAYAYLRRIVENEIKRLVKDISDLEYDGADKVKEAWEAYQSNHQMNTLIDSISPMLPSSLKEIGGNPIRTLYQQTSGGIHEFPEEECLEKAMDIDKLLQYTIKRIYSMKQEFKEAREAINRLNSK